MGFSTQDTFYVDPRVEGCDGLSSRAKRLGLKMKDFLSEGVTVCVAAAAASSKAAAEGGGQGGAGDMLAVSAGAGATAGADQSRGRRLSRIHRMVLQAQTDPSSKPGSEGQQQQQQQQCQDRGHTSIANQARQLRATVLSGQAFGCWLGRQESKRSTARAGAGAAVGAGGGAGAARAGTGGGKGKATARPRILCDKHRAGTSRFKSQEHPRVVMKDLDGLEPDRVQAFPPELLRKCNLHMDAPPGICPFTPREQWDREVVKVKKKDVGATKVGARMLPSGAQKPRRGGWCECCESQYIGTMSEHCAGDQHRAAVARDPSYAILLALESWTGAQDGSGRDDSTDTEPPSQTAANGQTAGAAVIEPTAGSSSSPVVASASGVGAGGGGATETVVVVRSSLAAVATNGREGGEVPPPQAAEVEGLRGGGGQNRPAALRTRESPPRSQNRGIAVGGGVGDGGVSSPVPCRTTGSGESVNGNQDTSYAKDDSNLRGALSPSGLRDATAGGRALRSSPRHRKKGKVVRCHEAGAAAAGGGEAGGGGDGVGVGRRGGQRRLSPPEAPPTVQPQTGSLESSGVVADGRGCAGNLAAVGASGSYERGADDAIPCLEKASATSGEETASTVAVEDASISKPVPGASPRKRAMTGRRTSSSPLPCKSPGPEDECGTARLVEQASGGLKDLKGATSPAAAAAATTTPATSVVSMPSSQAGCYSKESSGSSERPMCIAESPVRSHAHNGSSSPPSSSSPLLLPPPPPPSQRLENYPQRRGGNDRGGSGCKGETAGSNSSSAKAAADASSSPSAARRGPRESIEVACDTPGAAPSEHRYRGTDPTGDSDYQPTLPARVVTSSSNADEVVSPPSAVTGDGKTEKRKRRIQRQLAMLADTPAFCGVGASPAASASSSAVLRQTGSRSASRLTACDGRGRMISCSTSGSGSHRCSRDHNRDGSIGSATKKGGGSVVRHQSESPPSTGGSNRGGQDWRVKSKARKKERDESEGERGGGGGGSATTEESRYVYRYPTRTAVALAVAVVRERKGSDDAEMRGGGSRSASSGRRRRRDREPVSPDFSVEHKLKRVRRLPGTAVGISGAGDRNEPLSSRNGVTASGGSSAGRENSRIKGGGVRNRRKRQAPTPSTASRMGLETAGDSSDEGSGGSYAEDDEGQTSSPLLQSPGSNERARTVPRRLGSKFAEDHVGSSRGGGGSAPMATATRSKRPAAVGGSSEKSEPPGKRERATPAADLSPCTRSGSPRRRS